MSPDDQRRTPPLHVVVTDALGRPLRRPALVRWLRSVAPPRARGHLTLALVTDRAMRRLNREYAGHDHVTDVLSFPGDAIAPGASRRQGSRGPVAHLGDVVIATGMASRQARAEGHPAATEVRILALHGLLHLLGYDHAVDAGQMARVERRLRHKGGLREGLIERGADVGLRPGGPNAAAAPTARAQPIPSGRPRRLPGVPRGAKAGRRRG